MTTTRELARLYFEDGRVEDAIALYESTSNHYINGIDREAFNWSELNIMAELYMTVAVSSGRSELWRNFISRVKTVARWLCGRQFETWWNDRVDDAEWDLDNTRRRTEPRFVDTLNVGAYTLPLDIRIKLGKARLRLREKNEAMKHFEFLEGVSAMDQPDLLLEVADALLEAECWEDSLDLYSKVSESDEFNGPDLWLSMASAFKFTEDYAQAEECLDYVLASEANNTKAMVLLAEVYEITDRRQDALEMINRVIELRRPTDEQDTGTTADDLFSVADDQDTTFFKQDRTPRQRAVKGPVRRKGVNRRPNQRTEDLVAYEARKTEDTQTKFKSLELSSPDMLEGDPAATTLWMSAASDLIDDFRNIRYFYPSEKRHIFQGLVRPKKQKNAGTAADEDQLQGIADRLEDSITAGHAVLKTVAQSEELRGFHFSAWLEVFIQYAILLVEVGDSDEAFAVLEAAYSANVFYQNHSSFIRLHMVKMMLAIRAKDAKVGADEARWFMLNCLFRDDGQRFYSTALSSGLLCIDIFRDNGNQKFMLRLVKTMDSVLGNTAIPGTVSLKDLDDRPESIRPKQVHPVLLMLYGQIMASGRGHVASLRKTA
jgi:general transcription factor 3C polypeptide 3 (transcription factor C subunit 4)